MHSTSVCIDDRSVSVWHRTRVFASVFFAIRFTDGGVCSEGPQCFLAADSRRSRCERYCVGGRAFVRTSLKPPCKNVDYHCYSQLQLYSWHIAVRCCASRFGSACCGLSPAPGSQMVGMEPCFAKKAARKIWIQLVSCGTL